MSTHDERKTKPSYSVQFKAETVAMVVELGKSRKRVAQDLGLAPSTVSRWVIEWQHEHGEGSPSPARPVEAAEISQLRVENERLALENSFLKKAAAFFARELP